MEAGILFSWGGGRVDFLFMYIHVYIDTSTRTYCNSVSPQLVIEPSSAAAVAVTFSEAFKSLDPDLQKVAVILSGGNVELDNLPW